MENEAVTGGKYMSTKQDRLVIFTSSNGRDPWVPLFQHQVPEWVKEPDVMGRLVAGEMCMDPRSSSATDWFRAERAVVVH